MAIEKKEYLSKEKFSELQKELDFLTGTRRKEIAEQLEYAKSLGDLSENAEYHAAREDQARLEDRIGKITELLKRAEIVEHKKSDAVDVGNTVTVKNEDTGDKRIFTIVGSEEADSASGKLSHMSPLGSSLLGKKKGDTFTFSVPSGKKISYSVSKIE